MCDITLTSVSKAATRQGTHPGGFQSTTRFSLSTVTVITSSFNKESDWTKRSRDVFLWSTDVAAVAQTALNLRMPLRTVAAELSVLHYEEIERSTHRTLVQVLMGPEHLKANHPRKAGKAKVKRSRLEARARVAECPTPRAGTLAWYHV